MRFKAPNFYFFLCTGLWVLNLTTCSGAKTTSKKSDIDETSKQPTEVAGGFGLVCEILPTLDRIGCFVVGIDSKKLESDKALDFSPICDLGTEKISLEPATLNSRYHFQSSSNVIMSSETTCQLFKSESMGSSVPVTVTNVDPMRPQLITSNLTPQKVGTLLNAKTDYSQSDASIRYSESKIDATSPEEPNCENSPLFENYILKKNVKLKLITCLKIGATEFKSIPSISGYMCQCGLPPNAPSCYADTSSLSEGDRRVLWRSSGSLSVGDDITLRVQNGIAEWRQSIDETNILRNPEELNASTGRFLFDKR